MEEIITGIIKGAGYLIRACIESGAWDFSLRKPGKFLIKILWPPYWFKPVNDEGALITLAGILFWLIIFYAFYYLVNI